MTQPFRPRPLHLALSLAFGLHLPQASAQIEEVVVTAQKREESLQATPIAISAMSGDQLARMGITNFEQVALASPSLTFTPYPSSAGMMILYLRGQGVDDPMQITMDSSVGLYQDGFYIARPQGSAFDLADIERVEVLRGPQGMLYGRNTTGGAVNIISQKPSGEFGLKQTLTAGNYSYFRSLTTVDLPEWQGLSSKLTLLKSTKDGYVRNPGHSHDFGEKEELSGRLALRWQALDHLTADYFVEHGEIDSTPLYYPNAQLNGSTLPTHPYRGHDKRRSRSYRSVDLPLSTTRFEGHGLTLEWDVNDQLSIKSLTGYRKLYWTSYQDYMEAFTTDPDNLSGMGGPVINHTYDRVNNHQFSQEFQFVGDALNQSIQYVAGLYFFDEGGSHYEHDVTRMPDIFLDLIKDRSVSATTRSLAADAQVTWTPDILEQRLDITLGARQTRDKRTGKRRFMVDDSHEGLQEEDPAEARNSKRYSRFNPALTVNYNWTDDLSTYAKVVTGYKAGGASESSAIGQFHHTFSPEDVISYELGLKSHWLDRKLRLNAAAFYSKFDDMQLAFNSDPIDLAVLQAYNAGKATVKGVELELLYAPSDTLTLSLDYTWLDASMDHVKVLPDTVFDPATNSASPYQTGENIRKVFEVPYVSRDSVSLGIDYTFLRVATAEFSGRLDYHFQSKNYNTTTTGSAVPGRSHYQQPSHGLVNARLSMDMELPRGDQLQVSLWGKNVFNKQYPVHVLGLGSPVDLDMDILGVVPAGLTSTAKVWNEPATYGIEVTYQY